MNRHETDCKFDDSSHPFKSLGLECVMLGYGYAVIYPDRIVYQYLDGRYVVEYLIPTEFVSFLEKLDCDDHD